MMNYGKKTLACLALLSTLATGHATADTTIPEEKMVQMADQITDDELAQTATSALDERAKKGVTPGHIGAIFYGSPFPGQTTTNVVFPIKAIEFDKKGYYFSQEVFIGNKVGYIGLRPVHGEDMAAFSIFSDEAVNLMPSQCHAGADHRPGVSCTKFTKLEKGKNYYFTIALDPKDKDAKTMNVWKGYVSTSPKAYGTIIGKWGTPKDLGHINGIYAFFERYLKAPSCTELPKAIAEFGVPKSDGRPWIVKNAVQPKGPGNCHGKQGMSKMKITNKNGVVRFETM